MLTPGETAKKVKPSSSNSQAYTEVKQFNAAFDTRYAGSGATMNLLVSVMDPTIELLKFIQFMVSTKSDNLDLSHGSLHIQNCFLIACL